MHNTSLGSVPGAGAERGRGGYSKRNRNRGRGKGKDKDIVEVSSSVGLSPQVQQPVQGRLIEQELPAEHCSRNVDTTNVTTLRGDSQNPTLTRPGSASEEIHQRSPEAPPQREGKPGNREGTTSSQTFKSRNGRGTLSNDVVTVGRPAAVAAAVDSRGPVQDIDTLSSPTGPAPQIGPGPVTREGSGKLLCVDESGCSGNTGCGGSTAGPSPQTPAKRKNKKKKKGKVTVNCHVNSSDATAQLHVEHLAPATASNLEVGEIHGPSLGDTSQQPEGLNGSGVLMAPVVDTAVGKGLVPLIVAGIEVPSKPAPDIVDSNSPSEHADVSTAAAVGVSHGQALIQSSKRRRHRKKAQGSAAAQTQPTTEKVRSPAPLAPTAENTAPAALMEPTPLQRQRTAETTIQSGSKTVRSQETEGNDNTVDSGVPVVDTGAGRSNAKRKAKKKQQDKAKAATSCGDSTKKSALAVGSSTEQESKPQYQHFIPRLVLRGFASKEAREEARALGWRDPQVNVYSMKDSCINPTSVGQCYGYTNMYQDVSAADKMHIEKALSVLEGHAARAIVKIKDAQAKGASLVTLTRVERNNIRKFLFVMMYRGTRFWVKYNHSLEDYQYVDREEVLKFMRKRGFTKPIEVWLHTLKTILDTPIDPKEEWKRTIPEKCFNIDGQWFVYHMNDFFMAFVQPANPENEFIITESAFGVHEGPTQSGYRVHEGPASIPSPHTDKTSALSPEMRQLRREFGSPTGYHTVFHTVAPLSPKLLLVLRSHHLRDEESKRRHQKLAELYSPCPEHWKSPSIFEKLHLDFPQAAYVNPPWNHICEYTNEDKFGFTLHKISDQNVLKFNSVFLEHVKLKMTWESDAALKRTLTEYLDTERFLLPPNFASLGEEGLRRNLEIIRREQLYRLLAILEGHKGKGKELPVPPLSSHIKKHLEFEAKISQDPFSEGYLMLGGKPINYVHDFAQGELVTRMRNRIGDELSPPHLTVDFKVAVTRTEFVFFASLPPTVIWFHVLATKIPRQHLSKLMLQASFRKVTLIECTIEGKANAEYSCFKYFGGLSSSFLLEGTPLYDASIDADVLDPRREEAVPAELFLREMEVREMARNIGVVKAKWGEEVDKFVWEWLYGFLN